MDRRTTEEWSWEDKQAEIYRLLRVHPMKVQDTVDLEFFDCYRTASHWFNKRQTRKHVPEGRKLVRDVGEIVSEGRGRRARLYCNGWVPKSDNLRHEHEITTFWFQYYGDIEGERGPFVDEMRADSDIYIGPYFFYLEMFCGTQTREQVQRRWKKYKDCPHDIRIVISARDGKHEQWLEKVKLWSKDIYTRAYFTTMDRIIQHGPYAFVWDHYDGEWVESKIDDPAENGDLMQSDESQTPQQQEERGHAVLN